MEKQCKKCGEFFPLTTKYFYKHSISPDGFRNVCKSCCKEETRKNYLKTPKIYKREEINQQELINARKSKRISRRKIAEDLNISLYTYIAIETKNKKTDKNLLNKIKEYLEI